MAKVEIAESLRDEILDKFKEESKVIFRLLYSLGDNPKKGKAIGNVGGIVIKELKYKVFRFYFITDGYKLKVMDSNKKCFEKGRQREVLMKILKEKSREYKGTNYYKYKVNIPELVLAKSGLKAGDELEVKARKDELVLRKS